MAVKDSVLQALKDNRNTYLSGEELSGKLGVSRAAVCKAVKALRGEGYEIEAVTNRGYMMPSDEAAISGEAVRNALPAHLRGMNIYVRDVLDSTNLEARRIVADEGAKAAPAVVLCRQQTAGRGRLGRSFFSPRDDGLYLSVVIKPAFDISRSSLVTVAAAAATSEAIDEVCGCPTEIKWVNDIYLKGKKVCGILTEASTDFETGQIEYLITGIGINTSEKSFPPELKDIAGSVSEEELTGHEKALLAAAVIERFIRYTKDLTGFMDSYRSRSLVTGKKITVYTGAYRKDPSVELGGRPAFAVGIDDGGGLIVEYEDGVRETLTSGEVSVRI
ncbi:MAG: biotin--[acetyl-CoA-carboxylase] ligase [Bacillota bacterium]